MSAPEPYRTGRVLCCGECGQPLEIVCPTHGAGAAQTVMEKLAVPMTTRRGTVRERRPRGAAQAAVLAALPVDPEAPAKVEDLAAALELSGAHVNGILAWLVRRGEAVRVRRGFYVRAVTP